MRTKWKYFQKIGDGEIVSLGFLSEEQRREMFENRLREVSLKLDTYETVHLSSMGRPAIQAALTELHHQSLILMHATDEEQLVDW